MSRNTTRFSQLCLAFISAGTAISAMQAAGQHYSEKKLTADLSGIATNTDRNLVNPWGLSRSSGSPWWVSDNGTGLSTLYDGTGLARSCPGNPADRLPAARTAGNGRCSAGPAQPLVVPGRQRFGSGLSNTCRCGRALAGARIHRQRAHRARACAGPVGPDAQVGGGQFEHQPSQTVVTAAPSFLKDAAALHLWYAEHRAHAAELIDGVVKSHAGARTCSSGQNDPGGPGFPRACNGKMPRTAGYGFGRLPRR